MKNRDEERRTSARLPFAEGIVINNSDEGIGHDVSEGGMFISTGHPYEADSIIDVTIPIKLKVKAVVKHQQTGKGLDVQFIDLDNNQKLLISYLVESLQVESPPKKGTEKQILIIEDNATIRGLYRAQLIADGFSVLEAGDGVEGIGLLTKNTPDLIVLDLYMKRMDGFKVLSAIKSSKWANIPVLIFSSLITQDVINKLIDCGADDFLIKQVTSPGELSKAIETVLERNKE